MKSYDRVLYRNGLVIFILGNTAVIAVEDSNVTDCLPFFIKAEQDFETEQYKSLCLCSICCKYEDFIPAFVQAELPEFEPLAKTLDKNTLHDAAKSLFAKALEKCLQDLDIDDAFVDNPSQLYGWSRTLISPILKPAKVFITGILKQESQKVLL